MIDTNETLLERLKIDDAHEAWREFYQLYWGAILRYARKLGLNETQAQDVLQETMVTLMRILPAFIYDRNKGRFRNFLLTIVHRKSLAVHRRVRRATEVPWEEMTGSESTAPFAADHVLGSEALDRWREALCEEAILRLREDTSLAANTFAVFEAYVLERQPVAAVAAEFGLKENAIYQIKNRLLRRLQSEVARLMKSGGSEPDL